MIYTEKGRNSGEDKGVSYAPGKCLPWLSITTLSGCGGAGLWEWQQGKRKTATGPKMEDGGFLKSKNSKVSLDLSFNIFYETKGSTF